MSRYAGYTGNTVILFKNKRNYRNCTPALMSLKYLYPLFLALDIAVQQRDYLVSIQRGTFYYDQTIEILCSEGVHGEQLKTPDAC